MPNRNLPKFDTDILENYKYDVRQDENDHEIKSFLDQFQKLPKDRFNFQDVTLLLQDFSPTE